MNDIAVKATLMARIAAPLLSASIRATENLNGETLAQHFAQDINRVVPIAQILVEALKPQNEEEHNAVNAIVAPVAAQLVAQNPDLFGEDNTEELVRLLKPSINVLASFCDRETSAPPLDALEGGLPRSLLALSPVVGCLSQYAFGKSPARRLTDALDVWLRAQEELFGGLPRGLSQDGEFRVAVQEAAAELFCSHFRAMQEERDRSAGDATPDAQFKTLLAQWDQSLALLDVLVRHAGLDDSESAQQGGNVRPLRTQKTDESEEGDEDEEGRGSGSGGGVTNKAVYNPMSFFAKKGL